MGSQRLLFVIASPEFLRYYDSTMRLLAERGHEVSVAVNSLRERKHARLNQLVNDPRVQVVGLVPPRDDHWTAFAHGLRGTFDFIRYLHPRLAGATSLRLRSKRKSLPAVLHWLDRIPQVAPGTLDRIIGALRRVESAVPISGRVAEFLRAQRPDVVVVSPLIDHASDQVDIVRAAQASGIPVVAAVASWDNLTNKGHMRVQPDVVTVWNEYQKEEAVTLHGIPSERVVVTGAQLFDRWFERQPSQVRSAFCGMVGLPDSRPFILYTGSSVFIARSELEVPFARRWLAALRASEDPVLREVAVLFRPHPFNADAWEQADFSEFGAVAVWPRQRYTPAAEEARTSFFDSLFFAAAVVGINTSAMIEAAIVGRPVLSVTGSEFSSTQEGTLHFQYLLPQNGGFLRVAEQFDVHVKQLAEVLQTPEVTRAETARFVERFIRPAGLATPCTPILADAIESASRGGPRVPVRETVGTYALRALLWPVAGAWTLAESSDGPLRAAGKFRDQVSRGTRRSMKRAGKGLARARKVIRRSLRGGVR